MNKSGHGIWRWRFPGYPRQNIWKWKYRKCFEIFNIQRTNKQVDIHNRRPTLQLKKTMLNQKICSGLKAETFFQMLNFIIARQKVQSLQTLVALPLTGELIILIIAIKDCPRSAQFLYFLDGFVRDTSRKMV